MHPENEKNYLSAVRRLMGGNHLKPGQVTYFAKKDMILAQFLDNGQPTTVFNALNVQHSQHEIADMHTHNAYANGDRVSSFPCR